MVDLNNEEVHAGYDPGAVFDAIRSNRQLIGKSIRWVRVYLSFVPSFSFIVLAIFFFLVLCAIVMTPMGGTAKHKDPKGGERKGTHED